MFALAVLAAPALLEAQAELQGRVLAEPERRPIANATITVPGLAIRTATDSLGRFRLTKIPRGEHLVVTRALGFRPDSARAAFDGDETVVSDIVLEPAVNELPTVTVRAAAPPPRQGKMAAFDARKALGVYGDGTAVYSSSSEQVPLFDVNRMQASEIEGVEVYTGLGQIPAQYNKSVRRMWRDADRAARRTAAHQPRCEALGGGSDRQSAGLTK